ncbi:MAG: 4-hydroxy-3-methylbut-2-enyl diphosphate reductase [bacterium]
MRVDLAESAGFCFGVKRALHMAEETAARGGRLYMLGELVHNEHVLREIEAWGIKRIRRLVKGRGKRALLISAHGVPKAVIVKARNLGYSIVDATCPMVKHIHRIAAKMEKQGRSVLVIGDRDHDEVRGIVGQLKNGAIVIDGKSGKLPGTLKRIARAAVVVQSTQDASTVQKTIAGIRSIVSDLEFHNTICRPTGRKQQEIMSLAKGNDVVVVIGSETSANTKRLREISSSVNRRTHMVGSVKDIDPRWFRGCRSVGVSAGASTPESAIREVVGHIAGLNG